MQVIKNHKALTKLKPPKVARDTGDEWRWGQAELRNYVPNVAWRLARPRQVLGTFILPLGEMWDNAQFWAEEWHDLTGVFKRLWDSRRKTAGYNSNSGQDSIAANEGE